MPWRGWSGVAPISHRLRRCVRGVRRHPIFPWPAAFPPSPPPLLPVLFGDFVGTTQLSDFSLPCITGFGPPAFPVRTDRHRPARREISRFPRKELPDVPGSQTTRSRWGTGDSVPHRVAFRSTDSVGAPDMIRYVAPYLARPLPCQRFAPALADRRA